MQLPQDQRQVHSKKGSARQTENRDAASPIREDLFFNGKQDFQELRKKLGGILNGIYDNSIKKEDFNKRMSSIADDYSKEGMTPNELQSVVRAIGAFSKLESNIIAGQRAMNDPEKLNKAIAFHDTLPYNEWVNPQTVKQYKQSQTMINEWAKGYAADKGLDAVSVKTDNLDWGKWAVYGDGKSDGRGTIIDQLK